MGWQEDEMGYDKGVEEGQVLSVAAQQQQAGNPPQAGSALAQTLHRPTETAPSPKRWGFINTDLGRQEREH